MIKGGYKSEKRRTPFTTEERRAEVIRLKGVWDEKLNALLALEQTRDTVRRVKDCQQRIRELDRELARLDWRLAQVALKST